MDWILPDPSRHISGHHFDIVLTAAGAFQLVDVSSNGTFLHGERYRLSGPHDILDGDRFTVGPYILRAEVQHAAQIPEPYPAPPVRMPVEDTPPPPPPQAEMMPPPQAEMTPPPPPHDDFDDVWGDGPEPAAPVAPAPRSGLQQPGAFPSGQGGIGTQRPDFARMHGAPPPAGLTMSPSSRPRPLPPTGPAAPPPPQPQAPAAPPPPIPQAAPPPQPPQPVHQPAPQPVQQPAPPPGHAPQPTHDDAMLAAFLDGAGISDPSQLAIPPAELAYMLGRLTRGGTREIMQILQDRLAIKRFMGGQDRTMRIASGNNPMKFLTDPDQAFDTMFLKPREGYLKGDGGFENALQDIRRHQQAVMAALQPALAETIAGLSPADIEEAAGGGFVGGNRRKMWDEFVSRWEKRAAEGENGMLDAFVKAFSRHYSEAMRKL